MELTDLLKQTDKLPNIPEVVQQLIQSLGQANPDLNAIIQDVSKDATLSLKVLRLVNSAHFGLSRKVSSIDEAVVMLGIDQLRTLVIASGLIGASRQPENLNLREYWSKSFRVAELARWLTRRSAGRAQDADTAFTAGLIHNIGVLLLHLTTPDKAQAVDELVRETKCSRRAAERKSIGFTSPEAGSAFLRQWKFPENLCAATEFYKQPMVAPLEHQPLTAILNLACFLNATYQRGMPVEEIQKAFPADLAIVAELEPDTIDSLNEILDVEQSVDALLNS